ncbi:MAG: hypothetical protein ACQESC_02265 [Nanobdellota archaeon]
MKVSPVTSTVERDSVLSKAYNNRFNTFRMRHFEARFSSKAFVSYQKKSSVSQNTKKYNSCSFIAG